MLLRRRMRCVSLDETATGVLVSWEADIPEESAGNVDWPPGRGCMVARFIEPNMPPLPPVGSVADLVITDGPGDGLSAGLVHIAEGQSGQWLVDFRSRKGDPVASVLLSSADPAGAGFVSGAIYNFLLVAPEPR